MILLGDQCIQCEKNTNDRCPHCGEPVHKWLYGKTTYRPKEWPASLASELRIDRPAPCYDEHRETCKA